MSDLTGPLQIATFSLHLVCQVPAAMATSTGITNFDMRVKTGDALGQIAVIRRVLHIVPACCYLDTSSPGQPATPQDAARVFDAVRQFDHECPSSFSGSPAYTHHA